MTLDLGPIKERWNAAKNRAAKDTNIRASKRVNIGGAEAFIDNWIVGWGKDDGCQIEGTPNHWRWLAMILLGLADANDAPYTEDKPTPEIIPALVAEVEALRAALGAEREACDALHAEFVHYYTLAWCKDDEIGRAIEKRAKAAIERHDARRAPKIGGWE